MSRPGLPRLGHERASFAAMHGPGPARPSGCGSPQTTTTADVCGREQEMRRAAETQSSEPRTDQSTQSPPYDCAGSLPSLQWPIPPRYHVDGNRGLGDRDAEFEQFAVNLGSAPQRVLKTHSSDQVAHLSGDPRSATRRAGFPSPVAGKTLAMPAHDSLGPDD